jgi:TonB family C-terminal domain
MFLAFASSVVQAQTQKGPASVQGDFARPLAIYAPRAIYPLEARERRITGTGVFFLRVNVETGLVTQVACVRTTGSPILDNAATSAFWQWHFRPHKVSGIRIPITFAMP